MKDFYDTVVLGNNPANLFLAAILNKNNFKTLYIDFSEGRMFPIGKFSIDREFPVCDYFFDNPGIFSIIAGQLGFESYSSNTKVSEVMLNINGVKAEFPLSFEGYKSCLIKMFHCEKEFNKYFDTIIKLNSEWLNMVQTDSFPGMRAIPNILKYSKISHSAFVESLFNDSTLKEILCFFDVASDSNLVNMAGYLGQIFNSKITDYSSFYKYVNSLIKFRYTVDYNEVNYSYNAENMKFNIFCSGKEIEAISLVLSDDFKNVFQSKMADNCDKTIMLNYILQNMKKNEKGNNLLLHKLTTGEKIIVSVSYASEKVYVQADVSKADMNEQVIFEIDELVSEYGTIESKVQFKSSQRASMFIWDENSINDWDYNISNLKNNPLYSLDVPAGLFYTGKWGKAFCTCAEVTKNKIQKFFKDNNF